MVSQQVLDEKLVLKISKSREITTMNFFVKKFVKLKGDLHCVAK